MKKLLIVLAGFFFIGCKKDNQIARNLKGEKWKIVSYERTYYANSGVTNVQTASNVGYFEFSKGSTANISMNAMLSETSPGLTPYPLTFEVNSINYEVNGTNDSKYDAIVDFDNYPKAFYSYRINRTSRSKMKFTDDTNFQYLFGDGWIVVLLLEKE